MTSDEQSARHGSAWDAGYRRFESYRKLYPGAGYEWLLLSEFPKLGDEWAPMGAGNGPIDWQPWLESHSIACAWKPVDKNWCPMRRRLRKLEVHCGRCKRMRDMYTNCWWCGERC